MRIAVVGSGIAGLTAAYLLSKDGANEVTMYERSARLGMDSKGCDVEVQQADGKCSRVRIDVPLRVFQESYYPNLTHLYSEVEVPYRAENYASNFTSLDGDYFFGYRNLVWGRWSIPYIARLGCSREFWLILRDVARFFIFKRYNADAGGLLFKDFLLREGFSHAFIYRMIIPTLSVLCTCSYGAIERYPAHILIDYLRARSMNGVRRASGGAEHVASRLTAHCKAIHLNTTVSAITYRAEDRSCIVHEANGRDTVFDHVIMATQSNHAANILSNPSPSRVPHSKKRSELLSFLRSFEYESISVAMHSDPALMPKHQNHWSNINLIANNDATATMATIWMNRIQPSLGTHTNFFQTVNPFFDPKPELTHSLVTFERPIVTQRSLEAIPKIVDRQGEEGLWFVGSYAATGVPLLETGVTSAVAVARLLGASCSWSDTVPASMHARPSHRYTSLDSASLTSSSASWSRSLIVWLISVLALLGAVACYRL